MGKHKEEIPVKNNAQVSGYISEGNPNIQKEVDHKTKQVSSDNQEAQMVKQAIKDDQGLSAVAKDIRVSVKDGTVTLDGQVFTEQQSNLASNTATAVAVDDKVKNNMEITHFK